MLQAVPGHKPHYIKQRKVLHIQTLETTVAIERLALLLHIREVLGSNIHQKTGLPEDFRGFLQSLQEMPV
jgi:hypothetical protein